ncbi:GNAT family N-acetyltransferase [Candidatus Parcubacteria bacterium]|nr:GNAT family N-acetyltransferase [Candidatus Parcubacteria bacterium]
MERQEGVVSQESAEDFETSILTPENFEKFKVGLVDLMVDCFPQYDMSREFADQIISRQFKGELEVVALLIEKTNNQLIGFSKAHIYSDHPDIANIEFTGITSKKRGQKLVGLVIQKLEDELRNRNVQFVRRQSRIKDGYADAVERHYKDRIVETKESESGQTDPKRYFKIKL